jgi:hypothetical protein
VATGIIRTRRSIYEWMLTRSFLKAALIYLILAVCTSILLTLPDSVMIPSAFPVYFHLPIFGWLAQLSFGIALCLFPKYAAAKPRGHYFLGWSTLLLLSTGLFLRAIFEPLYGILKSPLSNGIAMAFGYGVRW